MKLIFIIVTLSVISYSHAQQQKKVYQSKTSERCSNLVGGSSITSIAECEQAAVGLGWDDVVVDSVNVYSDSEYFMPPGCYLSSFLAYNEKLTTSTMECSEYENCACSILCQPGTYQDENNQTTCKSCTAGFYQSVAGKSECNQACSTNTYSPLGADSCDHTATTCPIGTYASGSAACTLCAEGKYNDLTGQTSDADCKTCPGVVNGNRTVCSQKPAYQEMLGEQCYNLVGGSSITSIAECEQAAAGLGWGDVVVDSVDAFSSEYHPPGCYLSLSSVVLEYNEYILKYNEHTTSIESCNEMYGTICACSILCQPGTYQDGTYQDGQTTCKSCTAGKYQQLAGKSECQTCSAGKYQNVTGQSECNACSANTYSPPGAASCNTTCLGGTYASGAACVDTCPGGTYASGAACVDTCPGGTYASGAACVDTCLGGTYASGAACVDTCPGGTYASGAVCVNPSCSHADKLENCNETQLIDIKQFYNNRVQCSNDSAID
jgi:hypothetical protein